jgi:hypothetical protein
MPGDEPPPRRIDVDVETLRRILSAPVDAELATDLEAAEAPLEEPR